MELCMKKQILALMVGVAVLATSPAFAMDGDDIPTSTTPNRVLPTNEKPIKTMAEMTEEELQEAIKTYSEKRNTTIPNFAFEDLLIRRKRDPYEGTTEDFPQLKISGSMSPLAPWVTEDIEQARLKQDTETWYGAGRSLITDSSQRPAIQDSYKPPVKFREIGINGGIGLTYKPDFRNPYEWPEEHEINKK
jgi:hypothetical protein